MRGSPLDTIWGLSKLREQPLLLPSPLIASGPLPCRTFMEADTGVASPPPPAMPLLPPELLLRMLTMALGRLGVLLASRSTPPSCSGCCVRGLEGWAGQGVSQGEGGWAGQERAGQERAGQAGQGRGGAEGQAESRCRRAGRRRHVASGIAVSMPGGCGGSGQRPHPVPAPTHWLRTS